MSRVAGVAIILKKWLESAGLLRIPLESPPSVFSVLVNHVQLTPVARSRSSPSAGWRAKKPC